MIFILLALIVPATALDYFAVQIDNGRYKIFTKISGCTGAAYQSGDNRVLYQDEVWKIGTLKNDLTDCNTLPSIVQEYRTEGIQMPRDDTLSYWIDIKKTEKYGSDISIGIMIKALNKSVEVTGLNLVGGTKSYLGTKSKEDCLRTNWGKTNNYPDKHIVVSYQHSTSNCSFAFVDEAELEYDYQRSETLFFHPAGKMKNTINDSYSVCFNSASCCSRLLCCPGGQWKIQNAHENEQV